MVGEQGPKRPEDPGQGGRQQPSLAGPHLVREPGLLPPPREGCSAEPSKAPDKLVHLRPGGSVSWPVARGQHLTRRWREALGASAAATVECASYC